MLTRIDTRLRREASVYRFRFTCADCAYFDEPEARCSEGYPNEAHRDVNLQSDPQLLFCKSFELS